MVKKPIREFNLRNVDADDFINQAKGLRAVRERKRFEKHFLNFNNPKISQWVKDANNEQKELKHTNKRQKVSDQIKRGFDIVKKWKNEGQAKEK